MILIPIEGYRVYTPLITQLPTFPGGPSVAPSDAFPGVGTHEDQHRLRAQDIQGRCDRRGVGAAQGHLRVGEKKLLRQDIQDENMTKTS